MAQATRITLSLLAQRIEQITALCSLGCATTRAPRRTANAARHMTVRQMRAQRAVSQWTRQG